MAGRLLLLICSVVAFRSAALLRVVDEVEVYFGCGCFWHVQHGFATLEISSLHRTDGNISSRTAYAGGREPAGGLVCYHDGNAATDYGSLGNAEAVAMTVPRGSFAEFAGRFWELCPGGARNDPQDQGGEYRSVIGLPGGIRSPLMKELLVKAGHTTLAEGRGSDGDTLGTNTVFVYDTANFKAHVAEAYHQFHNDMVESYGSEYGALRKWASKTKCAGDQSGGASGGLW
eukprot:CAMPEP_0177163004 /NCGR_PEP_ID=MMETSP0367-20130122/6182_1 /TAXON_ID=447022 ORGANISM="Scrippsiella hangoei-like, Strain SHHI-4" /NCGR_SAMPLE_ID=MMETSP0367 /ASSEMBLY_ACC=CAM_ASM_000362 /LENGTH=229 /DNA_ID=CAMNT_0018608803 /DNA_START=63 /DNA_END=749 /DNA_ORIENTATION=-